jgi:hypothetical protein
MKKIIIIVAIFIIIIISGLFWFRFVFYGTPWGKKQALELVQEYLNDTYIQKMIVLNSSYEVNRNTYIVSAIPENKEDIRFLVFISNKKGIWNIWNDQYYLEYFSYELGLGANQKAKEIYGEESWAYADLYSETIDTFNIENLNEETRLENVIDVFNGKYRLSVHVYKGADSFDCNSDANRMLMFVKYVNSLMCKPYNISFFYENSSDESLLIILDEMEYQNITQVDDLLPYIQKKINK